MTLLLIRDWFLVCSVADLGYLSQILIFIHPGSPIAHLYWKIPDHASLLKDPRSPLNKICYYFRVDAPVPSKLPLLPSQVHSYLQVRPILKLFFYVCVVRISATVKSNRTSPKIQCCRCLPQIPDPISFPSRKSRVADPDWIRIQSGQWIRIRIRYPDPDPGGQKWPTKSRKIFNNSWFEVLDGLFWELKAPSVTLTYFMEA
jgi:hypothetical protein